MFYTIHFQTRTAGIFFRSKKPEAILHLRRFYVICVKINRARILFRSKKPECIPMYESKNSPKSSLLLLSATLRWSVIQKSTVKAGRD